MLSGYALAAAKRSWYVPDINIWGTAGWGVFEYLLVENVNSTKSVLFDTTSIGDSSQVLYFDDLIDHKGNQLPQTIKNPKVFLKPKTEERAYVIGDESSTGFKLVRNSDSRSPVLVDLYIVEMGD